MRVQLYDHSAFPALLKHVAGSAGGPLFPELSRVPSPVASLACNRHSELYNSLLKGRMA